MVVRLEYIGKGAAKRRTMDFLDGLRQRFPRVSEAGLHEIAKTELVRVPPRDKSVVQQLIGADILALDVQPDDLAPREAFTQTVLDEQNIMRSYFDEPSWLAEVEDRYREIIPQRVQAWPLLTPTVQTLILRTRRADRHKLVDPEGLSRTYVWRASNDFVTEVEDRDAEVIFRSAARYWFQNIDRHGRFVQPRAWDLPVIEREAFSDAVEAKRYERDLQRKPLWNGI